MRDIMRNFEQSIVKAGLPQPPKLSELVSQESVEEVGVTGETDSDRLTITSQTKPGWYRLNNGEQIYVNDYDIPGRPPINAGSLRGTVEIRQPHPKWVFGQLSPSPSEPVRPSYSGTNRQLKTTAKPLKWEEMINPSTVIVK